MYPRVEWSRCCESPAPNAAGRNGRCRTRARSPPPACRSRYDCTIRLLNPSVNLRGYLESARTINSLVAQSPPRNRPIHCSQSSPCSTGSTAWRPNRPCTRRRVGRIEIDGVGIGAGGLGELLRHSVDALRILDHVHHHDLKAHLRRRISICTTIATISATMPTASRLHQRKCSRKNAQRSRPRNRRKVSIFDSSALLGAAARSLTIRSCSSVNGRPLVRSSSRAITSTFHPYCGHSPHSRYSPHLTVR